MVMGHIQIILIEKKIKKQQENPINKKDNKCFQYSVKVALNQEEIKKDPQRIIQLKPFKKKYITGKE